MKKEIGRLFDKKTTDSLIGLLFEVPNGVLKMIEGTNAVEWSRSLGVIETKEDCVRVVFSSRSAIESELDASIEELNARAQAIGATVHHHGRYPGWAYNPDSPLRERYLALCEKMGMPTTVRVIHAGLECGVIASNLPGLDAISFGPNMADIHSPEEALDLASTARFWQKLVLLLKEPF
jgi:dipeptidase D